MEYKYKQDNIPGTIARAIFDNKKPDRNDRMYYREIKSNVEQLLHHPLSDRQLFGNLSTMVNKKLLNKDATTGRLKVYYSLTEKGMREYGLKIIGTDVEVQRRKRLYNLLIFFETYKRSPLITRRQLTRFLDIIGRQLTDFKIREIGTANQLAKTVYRFIDGIDILSIPEHDPLTGIKKILYYVAVPGFSVEEFIDYQKLLKCGKEPRPFSSPPTIVPFVVRTSFTKNEVEEAIASMKESGLIQQIDPVFPGEIRYNIVGEPLRELVYNIWLVRMLDYELLIRRLAHHKPTDQDKKYLKKYCGEKQADKVMTQANYARKLYKNEKKEQKQAIRHLDRDRRNLVQDITKKYDKVIQENEILRDVVEEICFSSFYMPTTS